MPKTVSYNYFAEYGILYMECPICLETRQSIFTNVCSHSWCKECHSRLMDHKHTTCVVCRSPIILPMKYRRKNNFYIEWLLSGGEPPLRWRPKRYRRGQFHLYKY